MSFLWTSLLKKSRSFCVGNENWKKSISSFCNVWLERRYGDKFLHHLLLLLLLSWNAVLFGVVVVVVVKATRFSNVNRKKLSNNCWHYFQMALMLLLPLMLRQRSVLNFTMRISFIIIIWNKNQFSTIRGQFHQCVYAQLLHKQVPKTQKAAWFDFFCAFGICARKSCS